MVKKRVVALWLMVGMLWLAGCSSGASHLSGMDATESARGVTLRLSESVLFDFGSASLRASAGPLLDRLAGVIGHSTRAVEVIGYTDSVGNSEYNQQLATQRAVSVRQALIDRGIDPVRLKAYGRGDADPVASNATDAGRAKNRRVEVLLVGERLSGVSPQ